MNYAIKTVTIALIVCCSGCGTTKETLFINSDPTGARVTLSNGMVGATPCSFVVPLKEKTVVTIEKDGYEPAQVTVAKKVSKKMVAGSAVAFLIDRKSTRLNSSHALISYAVFCLKKKKQKQYK